MRKVTAAGLVLGALLLAIVIRGNGGDPVILLAYGADAKSLDFAEALLGRGLATRPGWGHDGQYFFLQATDPLYLGDGEAARLLKWELYRGQRMFFPMIAGLGGVAPPALIPWMFAVVHLVAYGIGTAATARIAQQQEASPWWGLAFVANAALFMSVLIGGAGVLALALALAGVALLGDGRTRSAAAALALSVLTREVMLVFCAGVALSEWRRTRRFPIELAVVPLVSYTIWYGYMLLRLDYDAVVETNNGVSLPLVGFVRAAANWGDDPVAIVLAGVTLGICALLLRQLWAAPSPLVAGSVGFVLLATVLSEQVWSNYFDFTRALAPVYTAFVVSVFAVHRRSDEAIGAESRAIRPIQHAPAPAVGTLSSPFGPE